MDSELEDFKKQFSQFGLEQKFQIISWMLLYIIYLKWIRKSLILQRGLHSHVSKSIEHPDYIIADLEQALNASGKPGLKAVS